MFSFSIHNYWLRTIQKVKGIRYAKRVNFRRIVFLRIFGGPKVNFIPHTTYIYPQLMFGVFGILFWVFWWCCCLFVCSLLSFNDTSLLMTSLNYQAPCEYLPVGDGICWLLASSWRLLYLPSVKITIITIY